MPSNMEVELPKMLLSTLALDLQNSRLVCRASKQQPHDTLPGTPDELALPRQQRLLEGGRQRCVRAAVLAEK